MTRRDLYLAVAIMAMALIGHAMLPRYDWRHVGESSIGGERFVRIDRWTGDARLLLVGRDGYR